MSKKYPQKMIIIVCKISKYHKLSSPPFCSYNIINFYTHNININFFMSLYHEDSFFFNHYT